MRKLQIILYKIQNKTAILKETTMYKLHMIYSVYFIKDQQIQSIILKNYIFQKSELALTLSETLEEVNHELKSSI